MLIGNIYLLKKFCIQYICKVNKIQNFQKISIVVLHKVILMLVTFTHYLTNTCEVCCLSCTALLRSIMVTFGIQIHNNDFRRCYFKDDTQNFYERCNYRVGGQLDKRTEFSGLTHVCLSVCKSHVCLCVGVYAYCLSLCWFVCLSLWWSVGRCVGVYVWLSICLSVST